MPERESTHDTPAADLTGAEPALLIQLVVGVRNLNTRRSGLRIRLLPHPYGLPVTCTVTTKRSPTRKPDGVRAQTKEGRRPRDWSTRCGKRGGSGGQTPRLNQARSGEQGECSRGSQSRECLPRGPHARGRYRLVPCNRVLSDGFCFASLFKGSPAFQVARCCLTTLREGSAWLCTCSRSTRGKERGVPAAKRLGGVAGQAAGKTHNQGELVLALPAVRLCPQVGHFQVDGDRGLPPIAEALGNVSGREEDEPPSAAARHEAGRMDAPRVQPAG